MNQILLTRAAEDLRATLDKYAETDANASLLREALSNLIDRALRGDLQAPMPWQSIPGDWMFNETNLRQYRDLESAYARFKLQATGGEPPALRALRQRMGESTSY